MYVFDMRIFVGIINDVNSELIRINNQGVFYAVANKILLTPL